MQSSLRLGLTLVGVGPGDPSLLTLAAVDSIRSATVVAYPVAKNGVEGVAATIASKWIHSEQKRLPLLFPMVAEVELLRKAWRKATEELVAEVAEGERVVLLCQGDVSLFSTSSYVLMCLKAHHPECPVHLVPGITSFSAAAAAGFWPLSLQKEQLLVVPTPDHPKDLKVLIERHVCPERILVLLKLGHRWSWVRPILEDYGLLEEALFAERLGWSDQKLEPAVDVPCGSRHYFSLLLIRTGWPDFIV